MFDDLAPLFHALPKTTGGKLKEILTKELAAGAIGIGMRKTLFGNSHKVNVYSKS